MNSTKFQVLFFGAAIFSWLTITSVCYTLFLVFRDIMILMDVNASFNIIISNFLYLVIFTVLICLFLKNVNKLVKENIFIVLLITFFSTQILQFFYTLYFYEYIFENEKIDIYEYFDQVKNLNIKYYLGVICDILKYAISAILIFYYSRKPKLIS